MDDASTASDLDGSWIVAEIGTAGVLADAQPTIHFGADGRLSGSSGVNRFTGQFELIEWELRTSPLATTRMAGTAAAMEQEGRFVQALTTAGAVTIDGDGVTIGEGDGRLRLERAGDGTATSPEHPIAQTRGRDPSV